MRRTLLMLCLTFIVLFGALATTAFANSTPVGSLDVVTSTRVAGWAWDRDAGAGQIWIHIYVRRPNMTIRTVKAVTTPIYRSGVNSHLGRTYGFWGGGYHGFDTKIALNPGEIITAHAINAPAGYNPALGTKRVPRYPRGNVDTAGQNLVEGWAIDDDRKDLSIPVNMYVNGKFYKTVTANRYRQDGGIGYHGFRASVNFPNLDKVDVQFYAMGRDYAGRHDQKNKLIGRISGFPGRYNSRVSPKYGLGVMYMESNSYNTYSARPIQAAKVEGIGYYKTSTGKWKSFWSAIKYTSSNGSLFQRRAHVSYRANATYNRQYAQKGLHTFWNEGYKYVKGPTWTTKFF